MPFNLPDYNRCIQLIHLLDSMGISHRRNISLKDGDSRQTESVITKKQISHQKFLKYLEELDSSSVSLSNKKVSVDYEGLIRVNGAVSCVYIKNQIGKYLESRCVFDHTSHSHKWIYLSSYRFHLCECHTIQDMIRNSRKSRYVATRRSDGVFPVNIDNGEKTEIELRMCQYCKEILIRKGFYKEPFSLKEFFNEHSGLFNQDFQNEETVQTHESYTSDFPEISRKYRARINYVCEGCGVNCSEHHNLLHVHHKDGQRNNNLIHNLIGLCICCHSKQPLHQHLQTESIQEYEDCRSLQDKQGILTFE